MKICYVWVKDFRNLNNFGVNLSSDYKFNYDVDKNSITRKRSFGVPKDFFGESISDVIALIGRNGSGKSNALELICLALKNGKSKIKSDFLIIVEDEGNYFCYYSFPSNLEEPPASKFNISFEKYFRDIRDLKVVYFSNVYDGRRYFFDKSIKDISLNTEVRRSRLPNRGQSNKFNQQLDFIASSAFLNLNISPPKEVLLRIRRNNRIPKNINVGLNYQDYYPLIEEFEVIFHDRINDQKPISRLFNVMKYQFFFEYVSILLRNNSDSDLEGDVYGILKRCLLDIPFTKTDEVMDNLIVKLASLWGKCSNTGAIYKKITSDFYLKVELLLSLKDNYQSMKNFSHNVEGSRKNTVDNFIFSFEDLDSSCFIESIAKYFVVDRFFDLDWIGISSGHKAYLNLFSSIGSVLKGTRDNNILLCIDEGDLYLHPQWQVDFFDTLVESIPKITNKKVQVVLTSHSPFLLSDLPNQNLTILDENARMKSFDGVELEVKTFGANLFDLYSEAFFLKDTRRGKFSDRKIDYLIRGLSEDDPVPKRKKEYKGIANLVGDELLIYKFSKLLSDD